MDWKEANQRLNVPYCRDTSFISIDYPAVVKNKNIAIQTLGGAENISKVHAECNKRIPLFWRPDDVYCRPVYGDRHKATSLLMKVRRRRKKTEGAKYEYNVEIMGTIQVVYKFQAMSDFQYLPVQKQEDGSYKSIYDQIVLDKLISHKEYFNRDAPLFMPPLVFSRVDTPCDFLIRPDIAHKEGYKNPDMKRAPHLIGTVREKRTIYTIFVNYGEPVPEIPIEAAVRRSKSRYVNPDWEVQIKKLFDEKPLYLKVEIEQRLGYSKDKMKMILPALCFYWLDGPWRAQWNKFGFDPTKNASAKIYQTLDFRVRTSKPGQQVIQAKRTSFQQYRYTQQLKARPPAAKISIDTLGDTKDDHAGNNAQNKVILYQYFPDKVPVQRLTYYQLHYIHLEEVQELIHANDGKETRCTERDGWCGREVIDKCRELMYNVTERLLTKDESVQQSFKKRLKKKKRKRKYLDESEEEGGDITTAAGASGNNDDNEDFDETGVNEMDIDEG